MTFDNLDEKQKKHYLAAIYHRQVMNAITAGGNRSAGFDRPVGDDDDFAHHEMMANLHANHGGLDYDKIRYAADNPSTEESSEYYGGPALTPEQIYEKKHDNDAMLPFGAKEMLNGLKHHIVEREISANRGDDSAKKYHQKMAKWHSAMLGDPDLKWSPEEMDSFRQKSTTDEAEEDEGRRYSKDPTNYGTEVFPKYAHPSVQGLLQEEIPESSWDKGQLEKKIGKNHFLRPEDVAHFFKKDSERQAGTPEEDKNEVFFSTHPFLPHDQKVDVAHNKKRSRYGGYYQRDEHDHPAVTKDALQKIYEQELDPEVEAEKVSDFLGRRKFDRGLHDHTLNSEHPSVRALGINRLKDDSQKQIQAVQKEREHLLAGRDSALPHLMDKLPIKEIPAALNEIDQSYGRDSEEYKNALGSSWSGSWNRNYGSEDAADYVRYIAQNHPENLKLFTHGAEEGLKHLQPGDINLDNPRLSREVLRRLIESRHTQSGVLGKIIDKYGHSEDLIKHPNAPRGKIDQIRDDIFREATGRNGPKINHIIFAKNLLGNKNHSREDLDFARKIHKMAEEAGGMGTRTRKQHRFLTGALEDSPHWTHDELADKVEKVFQGGKKRVPSWILDHQNMSPALLHDIASESGENDFDIYDNKMTGPGTALMIAKRNPNLSLSALGDPRIPVDEAMKMFDSHVEEHGGRPASAAVSELVNHPFLPEEKMKEILTRFPQTGQKPKDLSPAILQQMQIAPPASVPNVRKDKLTYSVAHKPHSLAIESIAREFKDSPTISWGQVKRKLPHLENNQQIRQLFVDSPEMTQEQFRQKISSIPDQKFHVSYRNWKGMQRHNDAPQLVVQLNAASDFRKEMAKKSGLLDAFDQVRNRLYNRHHPVLPHTIGWARVDTSHPEHWFIDEIQSDIDADLKRHHDENISKLGKNADLVSKNLKGWNEHLLQHVINTARAHGVKRLTIHSKSTKMKANHGEDKPSSKYEEIYDKATRKAGFSRVKAKDVGIHDRSVHLSPESDVHTLDLTQHIPVASNAPMEMGKPIKRKRKSDAPQLFSPKSTENPEINKLAVDRGEGHDPF